MDNRVEDQMGTEKHVYKKICNRTVSTMSTILRYSFIMGCAMIR